MIDKWYPLKVLFWIVLGCIGLGALVSVKVGIVAFIGTLIYMAIIWLAARAQR